MQSGQLPLSELASPFDLQSTLESGQSYLWWRADGNDYEGGLYGGNNWYRTTTEVDDEHAVIAVCQTDECLEWRSHIDAEPILRDRLRLDDDLTAIRQGAPDDRIVEAAFEAYQGMRLVQEPPFQTLVSFICSAQMRVARIHGMQQALREAFGTPVEFDGETFFSYPTPGQLAEATEQELRDLSLGYRAPYVKRTAEMVRDGTDPADARERPYEQAREHLTQFVGVGQKVADCILLFSLGYTEAVPLDTWIRKIIDRYFPDCERGNYEETSRALRARLGGEYAGYTQTYLFHYLRHAEDPPE